jgi:hypothetical protein
MSWIGSGVTRRQCFVETTARIIQYNGIQSVCYIISHYPISTIYTTILQNVMTS